MEWNVYCIIRVGLLYQEDFKSMAKFCKLKNYLLNIRSYLQNHEDFEMKKLLFDMILVLSKDSAALPVR